MLQFMEPDHLKHLLVAKGKTQSQLAAALGRDKSAITNLLQGKRQVKLRELPKIADFLEVGVEELLGMSPAQRTNPSPSSAIPFYMPPGPLVQAMPIIAQQEAGFVLTMQLAIDNPVQCVAFEVPDHSLDLHGLVPQDIVICDLSAPCQAGNNVLVEVRAVDGSKQVVLRKYQPPFLNAYSTREGFERLHEERANVRMIAPVIQMLRYYA